MTVGDWLKWASAELLEAGIESSRLEAELLLASILHRPRLALMLESNRRLSSDEFESARIALNRRKSREPSQHIIGTAAFLSLDLMVNRFVLIPRPETEGLALLGIEEAHRLRGEGSPIRVLDFGTGSGALALALAQACPDAEVHAVDCSSEALEVAMQNAAQFGFSGRIRFHQSNGFSALPQDLTFDLILSNPPYIPSSEIMHLPPEVRDFDPHLALDGGSDGLGFYRLLAREAAPWLVPGCRLMAEFGDGQAIEIAALFQSAAWEVESIRKDLSERERVLIVQRPIQ